MIRIPHRASRLLVLGVMLMSALLLPLGDFLSHGIAALATVQADHRPGPAYQHDDHGHLHATGSPDVKASGHDHGHNPFDHSHEVGHLVRAYGQNFPVVLEELTLAPLPRLIERFPPLPDRPPMSITFT